MEIPEDQVIDSTHRYVLGVTNDYYGIWDKQGSPAPLMRFPMTDDGLTQAEERFWALSKSDVEERDVWSTRLRWVLFLALGIWVVSGGIYGALLIVAQTSGFSFEFSPGALQFAFTVQDIAFRVWIAAAVGLAALWLRRRAKRDDISTDTDDE